jgi:hypothetical protein
VTWVSLQDRFKHFLRSAYSILKIGDNGETSVDNSHVGRCIRAIYFSFIDYFNSFPVYIHFLTWAPYIRVSAINPQYRISRTSFSGDAYRRFLSPRFLSPWEVSCLPGWSSYCVSSNMEANILISQQSTRPQSINRLCNHIVQLTLYSWERLLREVSCPVDAILSLLFPPIYSNLRGREREWCHSTTRREI